MTTLKQRLAALGVEVGERPHMALSMPATADTLKWADDHSRRSVLAADLERVRLGYISLELACVALAGEVERLRAQCPMCDGQGGWMEQHGGLDANGNGEVWGEYRGCTNCQGTGVRP